jgi:hypothetical protein
MTWPVHGAGQGVSRRQAAASLSAELAFTLLPLLLILMVLFHAGRPADWWSSAEWSFAAAILFGQALVKLMTGLSRGGQAAAGSVALTVALILVFGLAPSLFVLTHVLIANEGAHQPAFWLRAAQIVLFVIAALAYLALGIIGETWRAH